MSPSSTRFAWTALLLACGASVDLGHASEATDASEGITISTGTSGGAGGASTDESKLDLGVTGAMSVANEGGESGCADVAVQVDPVIPTIVLLVDQSGSMDDPFGDISRWDALYDTLMETDGVVESLQAQARFGLTLYTSDKGFEGGRCPMLEVVPPALDNRDAIDAVYSAESPFKSTPTGASFAVTASDLAELDEPGPKVIVLCTDGVPDTCEDSDANGEQEVLDAVTAARDDDITTYVLAVGPEVGEQHLQDVANAGLGKPVDDPDPAPYWEALDADGLVVAFDEIIGEFVSCTLTIEGIVDLAQVCEGTVLLDGVELECGTDWNVPDPSTLELEGAACQTWRDGGTHAIEARWPCGAVEIP